MIGNRQMLGRLDRHLELADRRMERIDAHMNQGNLVLERIDAHMNQGNLVMKRIDAHVERGSQEFEMSHQILADVLKQSQERHRELVRRLEDIGVHMREQIQALMRIQAAVDPDAE